MGTNWGTAGHIADSVGDGVIILKWLGRTLLAVFPDPGLQMQLNLQFCILFLKPVLFSY